jgi:two-component system sensor histidine kinase AlgZ
MTLDARKLTLWSGRLQERLWPAWRWLNDRLLSRAADVAATLPGLFAPAPVESGDESHFLPNFCRGRAVFGIVLIAELLAVVITLITRRISENLFQDLALISLFVQWMALLSAATLCGARRYLNTLPKNRALGFAYLLLLAVELATSELAVWVLWLSGGIGSPRPDWYAYFHIQNFAVTAILSALALRYFLARHQLRQRTLSEARAKIEALRSRIRPHFLFNTMNIIASLIRSAPDKAEAAIEDMADLFRTMLGESENLVPVNNEIAIAKKYLDIEALRLDNRLRVDWDVGKFPRRAVMPVLTLQPLLENAIHHGIEQNPLGGTIQVRMREDGETLHIAVTNPLPRPRSKSAAVPRGDQTLDNLRLRLTSHYGEAAHLEVTEDRDRFTATVSIPTRGGNP